MTGGTDNAGSTGGSGGAGAIIGTGASPTDSGLRIQLVRPSSSAASGLVSVTVPSKQNSFLLPLPEGLYAGVSETNRLTAVAAPERGGELPSWLSFNPRTMTLTASSMPANALPLRVVVIIAGERTVISITLDGGGQP